MTIEPDQPIRGAGLKVLQKRMRRRAVHLGSNPEFLMDAREIRDAWNRFKEKRVIRTTDSPTFSEGVESRLRKDLKNNTTHVLEHETDFSDFNELWDASRLMAHKFFPQVDYYWPGIWAHHPAIAFCRGVIETGTAMPDLIEVPNPQAISLTSVLYDTGFTLSGGARDGDALLRNLLTGIQEGLSPMYLPLYPGVTALDIDAAARTAAEAARKHYESVSVPARVHHYKSEGLTQREISNKLGVPLKTIQTIWRQPQLG